VLLRCCSLSRHSAKWVTCPAAPCCVRTVHETISSFKFKAWSQWPRGMGSRARISQKACFAVQCKQRSCDGLITRASSPAKRLNWWIISEVILNWNRPQRLVRMCWWLWISRHSVIKHKLGKSFFVAVAYVFANVLPIHASFLAQTVYDDQWNYDEFERGCGRKRSWPDLRYYSSIFLEWLPRKTWITKASLRAEIWIWNLPKMRQECYHSVADVYMSAYFIGRHVCILWL
jgi:hypothetical protein